MEGTSHTKNAGTDGDDNYMATSAYGYFHLYAVVLHLIVVVCLSGWLWCLIKVIFFGCFAPLCGHFASLYTVDVSLTVQQEMLTVTQHSLWL